MTPPLRVLSVTSEISPLVKTGGLGDVTGALPAALAAKGVEVRSLVPGYPGVTAALQGAAAVHSVPDLFGGPARVLEGKAAGLHLFCIEAPHLYHRPGTPYGQPDGTDFPDNPQRFAALAQMAAAIGLGAAGSFAPDVVHGHDWHAGLAPAYLHYAGTARPATAMTIHNLAFQGRFPATLLRALGLPPASFDVNGVEYYGGIGFLKAGLRLADAITTVSPTYAAEICTPEGGMGLDGLLRTRSGALAGILNGIDTTVWDPGADVHLAAEFGGHRLRRRPRNKAALQARLGLAPDPDALLFGVVSRLTRQKGMDLLLDALPALLGHGAQLAVLGSGEPALQGGFAAAASAHPGRIGMLAGFDEDLAHLIQGGCDALLVPSRFEPCGLTQLCALRYGAVPVVAHVGGLVDTVIDANPAAQAAEVATGIQFAPVTTAGLEHAIARTVRLWQEPKAWARMQRNGMRGNYGWDVPAAEYAALYRTLRRH